MSNNLVWFWFAVLPWAGSALAAPPTWHITDRGPQADQLRLLSGGDGTAETVTVAGQACVRPKPGEKKPIGYLYFAIDRAIAKTLRGPVYILVEYHDDAFRLGSLQLQYDSDRGDKLTDRYCPAEDQAGGRMLGRQKWQQAVFLVKHPGFVGRQNLGADFRLYGSAVQLRRVEVCTACPPQWDVVDKQEVAVRPRCQIGPGGELIVGGFDPHSLESAVSQAKALEGALPALKSFGITSHEGYVRWNLCEPKPGQYDWSVYDRYVALYKKYQVKWVPFLIIGSAYSLPDWYYKSPEWCGYVCLEHDKPSDIDSLWNPALRGHVARFIAAFCEHYRDSGVIESILLGVTGNFGEAIYPATQGFGWTAQTHGDYHSHPGFWAGDRYARASFRAWLKLKYGTPNKLAAAWGKPVAKFDDVQPFLRVAASNDRAWLDLVDWYIGSMSDWSSFWMQTTRQHFAGGIYLCTGGNAVAEHGSDFGIQCKLAAAVHGGVRITNEGSLFDRNFTLTRWVASAGRQYGAYYSFEPASRVEPTGLVARTYNASTAGALGLHHYFGNLADKPESQDYYLHWTGQFRQRKPLIEVAVFYPTRHIHLHGNKFLSLVGSLRDRFDFDYQSENQIADGGLKPYRVLILLEGAVAEAKTWKSIEAWVRGGGVLVYPQSIGTLTTVEKETWPDQRLKATADLGQGRAVGLTPEAKTPAFRDALCKLLAGCAALDHRTLAMIELDACDDQVFASVVPGEGLIWLCSRPEKTTKGTGVRQITLEPWSITVQPID